jgi:fructose-1,6-bisphosphatase/inositol monophosphatase family enzyme
MLIAREAGVEIMNVEGGVWKWGDESLVAASPGIADKWIFNNV